MHNSRDKILPRIEMATKFRYVIHHNKPVGFLALEILPSFCRQLIARLISDPGSCWTLKLYGLGRGLHSMIGTSNNRGDVVSTLPRPLHFDFKTLPHICTYLTDVSIVLMETLPGIELTKNQSTLPFWLLKLYKSLSLPYRTTRLVPFQTP